MTSAPVTGLVEEKPPYMRSRDLSTLPTTASPVDGANILVLIAGGRGFQIPLDAKHGYG